MKPPNFLFSSLYCLFIKANELLVAHWNLLNI